MTKETLARLAREWLGFGLLAFVLIAIFPSVLDDFRLNLVGKYLSFGFVVLGLVLCWGYTGILSLGQGIFFGLGGYCIAMFLKLEASTPENTAIQSTPGIPDFMDWNQLTELPFFWEPFHSFAFTVFAIMAVPAAIAFILAYAMFKRRVGGVYFAIITQAVTAVLTILIIGQQGYTGGINGITDLRTLMGWDIRTDDARFALYFICVALLLVCILIGRFVLKSKLGRILVAIRDKEERVRFSGYDVANFKVFVFCTAAALAGIGGAMFTLQVGFMSPTIIGIVPSIEMVIFCALGGRLSLIGAVAGALIVNAAKTTFSEMFPELWLFAMGGLFIGVTLFFPKGLAGLVDDYVRPFLGRHLLGVKPNDRPAPTPAE
ncbi:urea ABC transporter permease subunit UrtC [Zavarzinia compransoris]|uniref:Urea ABC transporter permease subunit UrtC n=1 Tax=Zavarzinia compransoris TaxID=1264899 RepID=A0A317E7I1_9PROT|nr:urea ABC transporter permease subunit UrtC [Zavarzinia compransoris]PWR23088.1 urea ABC transporter permease subunit UrtC [Zavarzinia compransoris]TDP46363.1 amino acid/amide ABC transporter membrane protein 2 (HAAT family) [Zavarzinia compransoris]